MKKLSLRTIALFAILLTAVLTPLTGFLLRDSSIGEKDEILILVSDSIPKDDPRVSIWRDAAAEEGLPIRIMHDSEFLRPWTDRAAYAGIILPDHIHSVVSEVLFHTLREYVEQGGKLMLVYDAGTKTQQNTYVGEKTFFSEIAGIDYALYDRLRDKTIDRGTVLGSREILDALRVPPGKYISSPEIGYAHPLLVNGKVDFSGLHTISGYKYLELNYPGFVTGSTYGGKTLLVSPGIGLIAGYHPHGKGGILFVNLPLGYLKGQTDGLFLHGFLRYFGVNLLGLPTLSTVPDGIGGLVMNWHIDSNAALKPIQQMEALGVYSQGPYSIHITAGPDARKFGDGLGINVPENPSFQKWMHDAIKRGHVIGSHGGWIHDYFGLNVTEDNRKEFENYLVLNKRALEEAAGAVIQEYSAPVGNQPEWITSWLEDQGFLAYYFTGNTGMGPTRSYREGQLANRRIWSFPILTYEDVASFEDMLVKGISSAEVAKWLVDVADFSVRHRVARLVYFHPPGVMFYPQSVRAWLLHTAALQKSDPSFRWYTMTDLAKFLDAREKVAWTVSREHEGRTFTATHPDNLTRQTWVLPKSDYGRPVVTEGSAGISEDQQSWLVTAKSGQRIRFVQEKLMH